MFLVLSSWYVIFSMLLYSGLVVNAEFTVIKYLNCFLLTLCNLSEEVLKVQNGERAALCHISLWVFIPHIFYST
jgi:hypothetical protein